MRQLILMVLAIVCFAACECNAQCPGGVCPLPSVQSFRIESHDKAGSTWCQDCACQHCRSVSGGRSVAGLIASPFNALQSKADAQARSGRVFHTGSIVGGNFEGVGSGSTPEQALANCCRPASGSVVSQAVSRSRNGQYFAVRVYNAAGNSVRRVGRFFRR